MWPSRRKLGAQLTYGVQGPTVLELVLQSGRLQPKFFSPRPQSGPQLHPVENSTITVSDAPDPKTHVPVNFYNTLALPKNVVQGLEHESAFPKKSLWRDPAVGPKACSFTVGLAAYSLGLSHDGTTETQDLKDNVVAIRCLATVSLATTVKLVPLLPKVKNLWRHDEALKIALNVPSLLRHSLTHSVPFVVQQVEVCLYSGLLAIRGLTEVFFYRVYWDQGIRIDKTLHFESPDNMAHFAFKKNGFLTISTTGLFSSYAILSCQTKYRFEASIQLLKLDLSHWLRQYHIPDLNTILVFTRDSVVAINEDYQDASEEIVPKAYPQQGPRIKTWVPKHLKIPQMVLTSKTIVSFHIYSQLQDYAVHGTELFLLTSQEIIWVDLMPPQFLDRRISWKHFLDDADTSLGLGMSYVASSDSYVCVVFSANHQMAFVYTFGFVKGFPCLKTDPYLIKTSTKQTSEVLVFELVLDTTPLIFIAEHSLCDEPTITAYSETKDLAFKKKKAAATSDAPCSVPFLLAEEVREGLHALTLKFRESLSNSEESKASQQPVSQNGDTADPESVKMVQEYAFDLGSGIGPAFDEPEGDIPAYVSLAKIAQRVPAIKDIVEYDSMVKQLALHYKSEQIDLISDPSQDSAAILQTLEPYDEELREQAAVLLSSCLARARVEGLDAKLKKAADSEAAQCPTEVQEVLETWNVKDAAPKPIPIEPSLLRMAIGQSQQALTQAGDVYDPGLMEKPPKLQARDPNAVPEIAVVSSQEPSALQSLSDRLSQARLQTKSLGVKRPGSQGMSSRKKKKGGFA